MVNFHREAHRWYSSVTRCKDDELGRCGIDFVSCWPLGSKMLETVQLTCSTVVKKFPLYGQQSVSGQASTCAPGRSRLPLNTSHRPEETTSLLFCLPPAHGARSSILGCRARRRRVTFAGLVTPPPAAFRFLRQDAG